MAHPFWVLAACSFYICWRLRVRVFVFCFFLSGKYLIIEAHLEWKTTAVWVFYLRNVYKSTRETEGNWSIFTDLRTLSHLLTFSYDVVSHDDERRVSLWGWIEKRDVFGLFFPPTSYSKMPLCCEMTHWEMLLLCNMAKLTAGSQSKHFESQRDLPPEHLLKKINKDFVHKQSRCVAHF